MIVIKLHPRSLLKKTTKIHEVMLLLKKIYFVALTIAVHSSNALFFHLSMSAVYTERCRYK